MKNVVLTLSVVTLAVLTGCVKEIKPDSISDFAAAAAKTDNSVPEGSLEYVPNEIIVKFKKDVSESGKEKAFKNIEGKIKEKVLTRIMEQKGDNGFYLLTTPADVLEAVGKMKNLPEVEYAEPNYVFTHQDVSDDPYFTHNQLWGMSTGYGSGAVTAWGNNHTGSTDIVVGVIDEGINFEHQDFGPASSSNIWTNPIDLANGSDEDGNGYKDDIHGWDFVHNDNTVYDAGEDSHGTHVAGTIGAVGGNGIGVAGVCWNVKIISAKFLGPNGGSLTNAVKAINYMVDLKKNRGINIVALNNSWGGGGYSQSLYDAIESANQAGILFMAAAGNGNFLGIGQNNDKKAAYPASYTNTNVIAVAAITSSGSLASFSNYGAKSVDLGAPGSGIYSTLPGNTYGSYSGTSMATPHVTGAAALYASTHSGATAAQIKNAILSSTTPTSSLSGKTVTGGRLNVSGF